MSRRVLVHPLPGPEPARLPSAVSHHLLHVLRLRPGAALQLFDGEGREVAATLLDVEDGHAIARVDGPIQRVGSLEAHLLLALLKPKALDLALRMSVEAGITDLHLFQADRSQGRPPREDRWSRVTAAAAAQCGRADLPALRWHSTLDQALQALPDDLALFVALPGADARPSPTGRAGVIVGPEGGLTPAEVDRCLDRGAAPLSLGAWTLRADTAAALAAAFVCRQAPDPRGGDPI